MKPSLEFKIGQQLTITPQLQQAIRLLQLSSLELQQEIQEALENNPMLEENEDVAGQDGDNIESGDQPESGSPEPTDLHMDSSEGNMDEQPEWDNQYDSTVSSGASRSNNDGDLPDLDARNSAPESLSDYLHWQAQMSSFSSRDLNIAAAIIDSINEDGYLLSNLEDICSTLNKEENSDPYETDEVEAVLHCIQNFDPIGIGGRDLAETLQLQLRILDPATPYIEHAKQIATNTNLALLANRDTASLKRSLKFSQEELEQAIALIQQLNPRPGSSIHSTQSAYISPDVIVKKVKGRWRAELNSDSSPKLRINQMYEKMAQTSSKKTDKNDKKYLQDQLQQAKWFLKSLHSRNDTLLTVAKMIIDRQRAFLDHGAEAMRPLVLHDIAQAVEMHESTISRVTTNKYMLTPRGIFELKYFFSSHVGTVDGGTCSATAIRSLIKKLVEAEPSNKPISDSKIAKIMEDQGINVARRTIAKYRESMNIPPSNQRKALI
jgi:RNA polymerase sigma-54 factor